MDFSALSPHMNLVSCKWIYKLKRNADGSLQRYKAQLVVRGFNQIHAVDFDETFNPVVKSTTIRLILSVAYSHNWMIN